MSFPVGGIDPRQGTFTVGVVDGHGVEIVREAFANTAAGYGAAIGLLNARRAERVGQVGSACRDRAGRCGVRRPRSPGFAVRGPAPLAAAGPATQQRSQQPQAVAHPARKAAEGKTRRETRRAHKRQPANRVTRRIRRDENTRKQHHAPAARQESVRQALQA